MLTIYGKCVDCLLTYPRILVIHSAVCTKIKSPADSPSLCSLNDKIRTKDFPKDHNHLSSIADPLDSTAPWDPDAMLDDVTLKENVCFIVSTPIEEVDSTSVSSSVSQHTCVLI